VATIADVQRLAAALPEVVEADRRGSLTWSVGGKVFAWERPFSKADRKRFGSDPVPAEPILAVRVSDLAEKDAVLAARPDSFFTIPHFDGFAAVLVQLDRAPEHEIREALEDAWLAQAPQRLAEAYVSGRPG
jgi:hypothetical protein